MMTEKQARRSAEALLKKIQKAFNGFEVRVHENLGWHFSVTNGWFSVSQSESDWMVLHRPAHYTYYGNPVYHRDPVKAILLALRQRKQFVDEETKWLKSAQKSLDI